MDSHAKDFEFRGNAKEWFGIWIVNLLLTIVTIGIYSAWAKVRTKKYFYNNTYVEGRNFDYHATGKQILIGRIIVIVALIVFNLIVAAAPAIGIVLILALVGLFPWLIVRAMMFNARMSSFSNVRFNFTGGYGRAFVVFILAPIGAYLLLVALGGGAAYLGQTGNVAIAGLLGLIAVVIAFLIFPVIDRLVKQFSINNHKLGVAGFEMNVSNGPFIKAAIFASLWVVAVLVIGGVLFGASVVSMFSGLEAGAEPGPAEIGLIGIIYGLFFLAFLPAAFIYQAMIRNVVYNNTTLEGGHRFVSDVSAKSLLWIAVSNLVVVICTLGLMLPWAQVRMAKYLANHTDLIPGADMDSFIGEQQEKVTALGDAYSDIEGIDVGLPI